MISPFLRYPKHWCARCFSLKRGSILSGNAFFGERTGAKPVPRRRFQKGSLVIRGKNPMHYGIYREDVLQSNGTVRRVQRWVPLGFVSEMSVRAAWKALPGGGITFPRTHFAKTGQSAPDRYKHEDSAKLRGLSSQWRTFQKNS